MLRLLSVLRRPFEADLRALALLRVAVAVVVLLDLGIRSTDLEAHYSNLGVLPLPVLYTHSWNPYVFSLHTSSGLWQVQAVLFALAAVAAGFLLFGYRTRLATAVSWVLLVSVQNRNPLILQGGDDLLRMLLFWGFFLPWGRVWSLDARRQPASLSYFGAATVAYTVQLALVYWCTALLKSGPEWTQHGTALYYALSLDQVLLPGGRLLYPHPELLRFLTFATLYIELFLPLLLFLPFRVAWWRLVFVVVLVGFQLGIAVTLYVGLFYLINLASLLGVLPPNVLNWLETQLLPRAARLSTQLRAAARLVPWQPRLAAWRRGVRVQLHAAMELPAGLRRLGRAGREGLVIGALVYVCWWNLDSVTDGRWPMPEPARWLGYLVRIDQHWGMFAPTVFKDDGWYILDGTATNGRHLDLNRAGAPVSPAKPEAVVALFKNDRWRKYSENYLFVANDFMRPYYCNYWLRIWHENPAHPRLRRLEVVYMKEVSLPNYQTAPVQREVLCSCEMEAP